MTNPTTDTLLKGFEAEGMTFSLSPEGLKVDGPKKLITLNAAVIRQRKREITAALNWRSLRQAVNSLGSLEEMHKLFELRLLEMTISEPAFGGSKSLDRHEQAGNTPIRLLLDDKEVWRSADALPDSEPERRLKARRFYDEQVRVLPQSDTRYKLVELLANVASAIGEWGLENLDETLEQTREKLKAAVAKSGVENVRLNLLRQWDELDRACADLAGRNKWWEPEPERQTVRVQLPILTPEAEKLTDRKDRCAWALYYCEALAGGVDVRAWADVLEHQEVAA